MHSSSLVATAVFCSKKEFSAHMADAHNRRGAQHSHAYSHVGVGVGFKYGNTSATGMPSGFIDLDMSSPDPTRSLIGAMSSHLHAGSRHGSSNNNNNNSNMYPFPGGDSAYRGSDHVMLWGPQSSNINLVSPMLLDINPNFRVAGKYHTEPQLSPLYTSPTLPSFAL